MRWYLLLAVLGLSVAREASFAERPPGDQRLGSDRSRSAVDDPDSGYFASAGVVRFQLIQGRLRLDAPRHRKGSQTQELGSVYESITVTACRGIPSLHYVFQTPAQRMTLSVQHATHVRIESVFPETDERVVLDQPECGPVTLIFGQGEDKREFTGSTLLHVRLDDPAGFDQHFGMLIKRLLRGRSLRQLSKSTERILLTEAAAANAFTADQIHQCLQDLRSSKAAKRRKAEKQLLTWGTPVLPILRSIHHDDLDAEQIDRIRKLRNRLRWRDDDTPRSLAMLLINDRDHWSRLATHLSQEDTQLANVYLSRVGLQSLPLAGETVVRFASRPE